MVCDFCGGNCGQCGLTHIVGNVPFDFQRMVVNSHLFDRPIPTYQSVLRSIERLKKQVRRIW